ncbi:MAG: hypothetical protein ACRCZO_05680 [Cetobacterium sp.]|nr:hypothetical protein [Cetobacterium sp. ZOR0034]
MIVYIIGLFMSFLAGYYIRFKQEIENECIDCSYKNRCRYCIYE